MIKHSILLLLLGLSLSAHAQEIEWLTWEEALAQNQQEKKKILVDIYTTWCGWCKKMDSRTFQKKHIAEFVTDNYYAVRFDAEYKDDIIYNNKIYSYVAGFGKKGYHELAAEIMNGRMSYPTTVFIDENLDVIQPIPGFQDARTFEMIMKYFAGNHYQSTPWVKYEQSYKADEHSIRHLTPASLQPQVQPVKNN